MKPQRTVLSEAKFTNIRRKQKTDGDFTHRDYTKLPTIISLKNYMAEITQEFMAERRQKLGREYQVAAVTRMDYVTDSDTRYIFSVKVHAISTTLKMMPVIGYTTLKPKKQPSKFYELRFLMYIDLTNYLGKQTITNLKKDLQGAVAYYNCDCMSFHYHGIRYRARNWAMYPTSIPDPVQRVRFGMNSKVCKHIGSFSTDFLQFAPQFKSKIDSQITL